MSEKLKVGILGATGMVGQRFVTLLENHPWFEVVKLAASAHSAGKTYEEAVGPRWKMETPMPEYVKGMTVHDVADVAGMADGVDFVFSAVNMSKDEIRAIEEEYAKTETPVVSNNSAHRWTPDVPMVVPEINPEHFAVIEHQRKRLGTTRGFIARSRRTRRRWPRGRNSSRARSSSARIRRFPARARPSRTGLRWWATSSRSSPARRRRARRNRSRCSVTWMPTRARSCRSTAVSRSLRSASACPCSTATPPRYS